ncbi:MAG: hypothetical protein NDI91_08340 [Sulfuritalea sp.]|nr:hypothetical protein [Sulfuritalea sp.]
MRQTVPNRVAPAGAGVAAVEFDVGVAWLGNAAPMSKKHKPKAPNPARLKVHSILRSLSIRKIQNSSFH